MWDIGDLVLVEITIRDDSGALSDPKWDIGDQLFFEFVGPDGLPAVGSKGHAGTPYEYGVDTEIVKDGTGEYYIEIPALVAGTYSYRWSLFDALDVELGASEGSFQVKPAQAAATSYYISIPDIRGRITDAKLIQLTDFNSIGAVDESKITECIASACGMLDSYCGGRYSLPLTVTAQIKDAAIAIAIYKLHSLRQIAPEKVRTEYEDAISYLRDVAAGKATLDQAAVSQVISSGVVTRNHDTNPEVFDNTRLEGF
jgi:phage gp36-like protein